MSPMRTKTVTFKSLICRLYNIPLNNIMKSRELYTITYHHKTVKRKTTTIKLKFGTIGTIKHILNTAPTNSYVWTEKIHIRGLEL
jgi:hypothetical protein